MSSVPHPIGRRLALSFAAGAGVLLLTVTTTTYLLVGRQLSQQLDARLAEQAAVLAADVDPGDERDPATLASDLFGGDVPLDAQLLRRDASVVASTGTVPGGGPLVGADIVEATLAGQTATGTISVDDQPIRLHVRPVTGTELVMVTASDLGPVRVPQRTLLRVLGPISLLGVAGLTLVGWVITRRALHPLVDIAARTDRIGADDFDRRLPTRQTGDEVERLATTINGMLDRLADALNRERRFTADASHELRTPLAIVRGELELAVPTTSGRTQARLQSALEEIDRLAEMIDALLVLARTEADRLSTTEQVDLQRLVATITERFTPRALDHNVNLVSAAEGHLPGDTTALDRALSNLTDNAIRHTPPDGTVTITARSDHHGATITVQDTGPGVPDEHLPSLFDRFTRTDDARTNAGAGLGLAIVAAIAHAHHGRATATNPPEGGLRITLHLPPDLQAATSPPPPTTRQP